MASKSDKTEKATPKKKRDTRKKGQVPRSKELPFTVVFLVVLGTFAFLSSYVLTQFQKTFRLFWKGFFDIEITSSTIVELFMLMGWSVVALAAPFILLIFAVTLLTTFAQGGIVFTFEPMKFKPNKLNPVENAKKIFSKRGLVQLAKSVLLVSVCIYAASTVIGNNLDVFQKMLVMDIASILGTWSSLLFQTCLKVGICLVVISLGDYLFQRYQHEEDMKMTKQEVRDDMKDTEGQPLVKGRIRRLQRELASRRMMAAVETADVVVTNPTHFAVALKFDMSVMSAPQVVAKGQDFIARRIKKVAEEHEIPMVENVDLARTLYRSVEIGQEVPVELYRAVAQILAQVYRLKGKPVHQI